MAENEVIFRSHNEKVLQEVEVTNKQLAVENDESIQLDDDVELHFYCECSDENCKERIPITSKEYKLIHSDRDSFIIVKDHQVAEIEEVKEKNDRYWIVEKNISPSEGDTPDSLNLTPASNT